MGWRDFAIAPQAGEAGMLLRRALLVVFIAAAVVRLWAIGTLPLVVTSDGYDYIYNGALPFYNGEGFKLGTFRTPGYPLVIALSFFIFGVAPVGVLVLQHLMGCATALMVTGIAGRYVRPVWAMIPGLFAALDPTLLGFECTSQTETTTIFLVVLSAFLVLRARPNHLGIAMALGLAMGFSALVRPTNQVLAPFFALGLVLQPRLRLPRRATLLTMVVVGFSAVTVPWIVYNVQRGIPGLARGFGGALWVSMVQQDLLDREYLLSPEVRVLYEPVAAERGASDAMWAFIASPTLGKEVQKPENRDLLKKWAIASIKKDPGAYLSRVPYSLVWQLNYFPEGGWITQNQIRWFMWMVSCDAADMKRATINLRFTGEKAVQLQDLSMSGRGGALREFMGWWALHLPEGVPQIPVFILAVSAGVLALRRRDWPLVGVLLATGALMMVHVVMVFHQSRYTLPSSTVWLGTAVIVPGAIAQVLRARFAVRAGKSARHGPALAGQERVLDHGAVTAGRVGSGPAA